MLRCIFWGRVLFTFSVLIAASFTLMRAHFNAFKEQQQHQRQRRQFLFGLAKKKKT